MFSFTVEPVATRITGVVVLPDSTTASQWVIVDETTEPGFVLLTVQDQPNVYRLSEQAFRSLERPMVDALTIEALPTEARAGWGQREYDPVDQHYTNYVESNTGEIGAFRVSMPSQVGPFFLVGLNFGVLQGLVDHIQAMP